MLSALHALWLFTALASPHFLPRPEGQIAFTDSGGSGRPVVCVPGIGEVRGTWRRLTPILEKAGYRVIALDIRGQGESSAGFSDYGTEALGGDVVALLDALDLHGAILVGNSYGAAVAAWAAAERPDRVAALSLLGPFVRDFPMGFFTRTLLHTMLMRPWGASAWGSYYKTLYKAAPPADLEPYTEALVANLREPGRIEAVRAMMDASKAPAEKRLPALRIPVAVIMGTADSDFDDPAGEAQHVAQSFATPGRVVMVEGSGHYPQTEQPAVVAQAVQSLAAP